MPIVNCDTNSDLAYYSHWYYPKTEWKKLNLTWARINNFYSFDKNKLLSQVLDIKKNYGFEQFPIEKNSKKKRWSYRGIGLTARKGAPNPLYDALKLYDINGEIDITRTFKNMDHTSPQKIAPALYEKHFTEKTKVYTGELKRVLDKFKSPFCKTRIIELKRNGAVTPHVDFPYYKQIRLHSVLTTNNKTWWEVEGEKFQIPSDGHWYWFDVGRSHAVWNDGESDRIVLSLNLSVLEDENQNPINRDLSFEDLILSTRL